MKENAIRKINKMGKVAYIITKIAKIILIVCSSFLLVGTLICACLPKDLVTIKLNGDMAIKLNLQSAIPEETWDKIVNSNAGSANVNNMEYELTSFDISDSGVEISMASTEPLILEKSSFVGLLLSGFLSCLAATIAFFFINALCKSLRDCETPFEEAVISSMRRLAFSLIPWTVIGSVNNSITGYFTSASTDVRIAPDLGMVCTMLIIFALVFIFKYGAVLQKESDETL